MLKRLCLALTIGWLAAGPTLAAQSHAGPAQAAASSSESVAPFSSQEIAKAQKATPEPLDDRVKVSLLHEREVESSVPDITRPNHIKTLTGDMAKFYLAVYTMDAWECIRTDDPTICQSYLDSLKDPMGHLGFVLFSLSSRGAGRLTGFLSRGMIRGNPFGMMVGFFVQDLFSDLVASPTAVALRKTLSMPPGKERTEKRRQLLNRLWHETLANRGWWLDKAPDLIGMMGAAAINKLKFSLADSALDAGDGLVYFFNEGREARALLRVRTGLKLYRAATMGLKVVWEGSKIIRINPVAAIGSYVIETVLFLKFTDWISNPIRSAWDQHKFNVQFTKAQDALRTRLRSGQGVQAAADQMATAWDSLRKLPIEDALRKQAPYAEQVSQIDDQLTLLDRSLAWATGTLDDHGKWKPGVKTREFDDYDETFPWQSWAGSAGNITQQIFCGSQPDEAVWEPLSFLGLPVPGFENLRLRIPRLFEGPAPFATCHLRDVRDMNEAKAKARILKECQASPDAICVLKPDGSPQDGMGVYDWHLAVLAQNEIQYLLTHNIVTERENAFYAVEQQVEPLRREKIDKYEIAVQRTILQSLLGREVTIRKGVVHLGDPIRRGRTLGPNESAAALRPNLIDRLPYGVMPAFEAEEAFWKALESGYPRYSGDFNEMLRRVAAKRGFAKQVLDYSMKPPGHRTLPEIADPLVQALNADDQKQLENIEPWRKSLRIWEELILH